jgi:putative membrane protein insertion efficiency factor
MTGFRRLFLLLIRFYQYFISPLFPPCCRYFPSCSAYAYEAVEKFGILKGLFLAGKRILRCHPFHSGGYDPVPDTFSFVSPVKKGI